MAQPSAPAPEPRPKRVFVHVGAPKTGTTFIQSVLWRNREQLADDGVLYPYATRHQHFRAMLDLRERGWGSHPPGYWRGTWQAVAERATSWSGHTVVLGNEILGGATEGQIQRLADSLEPAEVHVIFTARDLARQLVSDWQEHLKHKHTVTLEDFVDDLIEHGLDATPPFGEMFWGLHDADHVLQRWAKVIPAERIHVVTLPPPGTPGNALWQRFCQVTGLDPDRYSLQVRRTNTSLGRAEAEVVRRLNEGAQRIQGRHYDALVRVHLSGRVLTGAGGRIVLPEGRMEWVQQRSRAIVDALAQSGYDVVGDLEELMPRPEDHRGYVPTSAIKPAQMLPVAVDAAGALLRLAAKQRRQLHRYRRRLGELPPEPPGQFGPLAKAAWADLKGRARRRVRGRVRRRRRQP